MSCFHILPSWSQWIPATTAKLFRLQVNTYCTLSHWRPKPVGFFLQRERGITDQLHCHSVRNTEVSKELLNKCAFLLSHLSPIQEEKKSNKPHQMIEDTLTVTNKWCNALSFWPGRGLKEAVGQLIPAEWGQDRKGKTFILHTHTNLMSLIMEAIALPWGEVYTERVEWYLFS